MEEKYGHYNDDDDTEKKNRLGMNVVFGMIMIAIYLGMAYLLLFTSLFSNLYDIKKSSKRKTKMNLLRTMQ